MMNKLLLTFISLLLLTNVNCQLVKKEVIYPDLKIKEIFNVLKNNEQIKQGPYEKFIVTSKGAKLIETGTYSNNQKFGIWTYYDEQKRISLQYNFDNDSVMMFNNMQVDGLQKNRPLIYLGSAYEIHQICKFGVRITSEAFKLGQGGKVIVSINVSGEGKVDYEIKQHVNPVLDNEALRVAKLVPQSWLAARKDGEPVSFNYDLPITFIIDKKIYPI